MSIRKLSIPDLIVVQPKRFGDSRGYFEETWNRRDFLTAGIAVDFVQDNHSLSEAKGTLRGMHFQTPPSAQDKLVRCTKGAIYDVAVDIRRGSPTYGAWAGVELSAQTGEQLFVPKGFAHGFVTLEPHTEVQYKCSDYYDPACDRSIRCDSLNIDWPLPVAPIISEKDAAAPPFDALMSPFDFGSDQ
ncbi:dTDP-4-dehydrorhamnose 3,5-epimerase [Loktanella sp. D2R18]|uniref:dTDP-4-dehydrorhamnose 3,5-epimerase n=1 Tax=Loktanella sp. D2R18 TaxID=2267230 RepID=UPI00385735B3